MKKQVFEVVKSVAYYLFLSMVIAIAILAIVSSNKINLGYKVFSVQSGSMRPTINTGDLIIVKAEKDYKAGDVIAFESGSSNGKPLVITHRIVEVRMLGQLEAYQTKGDYNSVPDVEITPKTSVIGKYVFKFPLLGYLVTFARTVPGFVLLVVIPATMIIYDEFNKIKDVWREKKVKKKTKK